jgi:hypothetical protein
MKTKMAQSKQKIAQLRTGKEIKMMHASINEIKHKML